MFLTSALPEEGFDGADVEISCVLKRGGASCRTQLNLTKLKSCFAPRGAAAALRRQALSQRLPPAGGGGGGGIVYPKGDLKVTCVWLGSSSENDALAKVSARFSRSEGILGMPGLYFTGTGTAGSYFSRAVGLYALYRVDKA